MAEISFWNEALHLGQALALAIGRRGGGGGRLRYQEAGEGGRINPGDLPLALAVSRSGCTFPPLSSGKLARLMLRQWDSCTDGVSRWSLASAAVALARRSVASERCPRFMSRVKSFQD